jgi:hypothetical protein
MAFWSEKEGTLAPAFASATDAIAFALLPDTELPVDGEVVVPEVVGAIAVSSVPIPWLIETNCSRLFTCASCVMYSFGSVGCVGSWFCNSLTSSVRKSFAVISDELAALLALVVEVVGVVESFGVACTARREDSAEPTVLAADVPDVAIELSCVTSIVRSPQLKFRSTRPFHARTLNQFPPFAYAAGGNDPSSTPFKLRYVIVSSEPFNVAFLRL